MSRIKYDIISQILTIITRSHINKFTGNCYKIKKIKIVNCDKSIFNFLFLSNEESVIKF